MRSVTQCGWPSGGRKPPFNNTDQTYATNHDELHSRDDDDFDDASSVSTTVSSEMNADLDTDFSCESSSSLFPSVPSADGVGTCPRYRFDDFMTDCLQEDSAFNSIHAGFLLDFSVAFDLGFSDHLLAQDCHGMHRRVFWCWECLSCDVIPPCDGCGESMCKCAIVLNDCHSDCESDCEMHESECEPTWRHMLCEAFFAAPDCKFANKEFCEARCLSYPQVLQNTVGEASAARLHRRLVDRVCQAATDGDMLIVTWAASFAARGAAHAAAKWAIAASKLVSELQQRERRRLRRAMRAGRGAGAVMEELVAEVVAGIAAAVSIEAAGAAAAELRRHKLVSAGLVRTTKGKRGVGSGRRRRRKQWRRVRAMEQQEQEQVQREVRERLDHVRWEEEQEQRWWRRAVSMWMQRRRAVVVDGRRYIRGQRRWVLNNPNHDRTRRVTKGDDGGCAPAGLCGRRVRAAVCGWGHGPRYRLGGGGKQGWVT